MYEVCSTPTDVCGTILQSLQAVAFPGQDDAEELQIGDQTSAAALSQLLFVAGTPYHDRRQAIAATLSPNDA